MYVDFARKRGYFYWKLNINDPKFTSKLTFHLFRYTKPEIIEVNINSCIIHEIISCKELVNRAENVTT